MKILEYKGENPSHQRSDNRIHQAQGFSQFFVLRNESGCSEYELEKAVKRALQLNPNLAETKLFNVYRHYYHASMSEEDLQVTIKMKENYIR